MRPVDIVDRLLALGPLARDVLALLALLGLRADLLQAFAGSIKARGQGVDDRPQAIRDGVEPVAGAGQVSGAGIGPGDRLFPRFEVGLDAFQPVTDRLQRLRDRGLGLGRLGGGGRCGRLSLRRRSGGRCGRGLRR